MPSHSMAGSSNAAYGRRMPLRYSGRASPLQARLGYRSRGRGSEVPVGLGVRTVAVGEARYKPMSHYNGSVRPHDSALIVHGLARMGQVDAACKLTSAVLDRPP